MARRKLSHQQTRRIAARRRRELADVPMGDEAAQPGLVIASHGRRVLVENETGERRSCHLRANLDTLVAGDRVRWQPSEDSGVVIAQETRDNCLRRPDARGQLRPVAANIDLMLVVIAAVPEPHANLIDRYLVAARHEAIDVALVLNKADLLTPDSPLPGLLREYEALSYQTVTTGTEDTHADALKDLIAGKSLVFVGQSGVGKSSLIQRLLPDMEVRVGALSDAAGKGRHTTTAAELFHLPGGGRLIDSPGIRDFHLHHLPEPEVADGFREFAPFLGHCRFRDCRHREEIDCAIKAAVEAGAISQRRFASYCNIVDAEPGTI